MKVRLDTGQAGYKGSGWIQVRLDTCQAGYMSGWIQGVRLDTGQAGYRSVDTGQATHISVPVIS